MERYKQHNLALYTLRTLFPISLISALIGYKNLGMILYLICFGISLFMIKLKKEVQIIESKMEEKKQKRIIFIVGILIVIILSIIYLNINEALHEKSVLYDK